MAKIRRAIPIGAIGEFITPPPPPPFKIKSNPKAKFELQRYKEQRYSLQGIKRKLWYNSCCERNHQNENEANNINKLFGLIRELE